MSLTTICFLLYLLLALTTWPRQAPKLVSADDKLIQIACHNAEVPVTCMQCIKSDPGGETADTVGIVAILVNCLGNHATSLAANMSILASGTGDQAVKSILQACGQGYSSARKDLSAATSGLKIGKYEDAEKFVGEALEYELTCQSNIGAYKERIPAYLVSEMKIYEDLSEAAKRILERL